MLFLSFIFLLQNASQQIYPKKQKLFNQINGKDEVRQFWQKRQSYKLLKFQLKEIYIQLMLQLLFTVRANTSPGQKIKVVGSIKELGLWNTQNALQLNQHKDKWQGAITTNEAQIKIEFKLIKIKPNNEIEWEQLPNNANRKFKPKFSTQFHLEWSKPAGKVNSISKFSYKLKGLPAVIIKKTKQEHSDKKRQQEFDPYSIAHNNDDSGQSDQQEFLLVKRKMSDQININSTDLEEIYYKNSAVEILSGLLKKIKVYVITKELQQTHSLHNYIEQQLCKLPSNFLPRWITEECFSHQNFCNKLKRQGSIFEIGKEEMMLQSLYSRTSYFILLQIEVALSLGNQLQKVPCCLFLPSDQYNQAIKNLNNLMYIDIICFDSVTANREFYQYLKTKQNQQTGSQSESISLFKQIPSIEFIVQQLQRLRQRSLIVVASIDNISQTECLEKITKQNTMNIIDYQIITEHTFFAQKIFENMGQHSMYLIISDQKLPRLALQFKEQKDVVLIYDNFQKILIQGKEYFPIRSFRQTIDLIKLKSKIYKESIGGEILQRQNSLIYIIPQGRMEVAMKLEIQCKSFVKKFSFAKVSRKGLRVKVSWNLSKEIRLLRSLCQIKLMNYGQLGNFNLLSTQSNFKDIRQDLKLLIDHEPNFFVQNVDTNITYYSYGGKKKSLSIVPESAHII